jgi:hypothetical protein
LSLGLLNSSNFQPNVSGLTFELFLSEMIEEISKKLLIFQKVKKFKKFKKFQRTVRLKINLENTVKKALKKAKQKLLLFLRANRVLNLYR